MKRYGQFDETDPADFIAVRALVYTLHPYNLLSTRGGGRGGRESSAPRGALSLPGPLAEVPSIRQVPRGESRTRCTHRGGRGSCIRDAGSVGVFESSLRERLEGTCAELYDRWVESWQSCAGTREWGRLASWQRASRRLTGAVHGRGGLATAASTHAMTTISRAPRFWRPVHTPLMYLLARTGSGPAGWPCHWSVREPGMSDVFTCETRPGRRSCPSRSSAPRRNHRPSSRRCPVRRRALR